MYKLLTFGCVQIPQAGSADKFANAFKVFMFFFINEWIDELQW